jgi:NAD(P)H-nitrite reductase large subunit
MACALHPAAEAAGDGPSGGPAGGLQRAMPPAMTRCECAGVTFQEFAARMAASGATLEEASLRTGCGRTCTACLPDLLQYLARC